MADRAWLRVLATAGMLFGMLASSAASADRTIPSALFVSKSENRNQVHYAVRVDDRCDLASRAPVYAYWRMYEKGPKAVEPLLEREQAAYGIARQQVAGDAVVVWLRALPARPITIRVAREPNGACAATAETRIAGHEARLYNVHVALGFLHVDHLLLTGWEEPDGRLVRERIEPR
jgi:hypothetical protein